ncbi:unnamed protein product, partial [Effrenium voratum]
VCRARYPNSPAKEIAAAVHGARCGCNVGPIYETFTEVDSVYCNYPCKNYLNPICGGLPSFWNVFVQYDFQSFASHGAYDPWRKIWHGCPVLWCFWLSRDAALPGENFTRGLAQSKLAALIGAGIRWWQ